MNITKSFGISLVLALSATSIAAQDHDHHVDATAEPVEEADHAAMGHDVPAEPVEEVDHASMGHGVPAEPVEEVDHAAMGHDVPVEPVEEVDHAAMGHGMPASPRSPIPPVTAARSAARRPSLA